MTDGLNQPKKDIGGGWPLEPGLDAALSHVPLVWMVREAQRAGLNFDDRKVRALNCAAPSPGPTLANLNEGTTIPDIALSAPSPRVEDHQEEPSLSLSPLQQEQQQRQAELPDTSEKPPQPSTPDGSAASNEPFSSPFARMLHTAATGGPIHDVLQFSNGAGALGVISWNAMEYLPFRRMDLQPDGSWRSVAWPLPMGEVRDVPKDVVVHGSVLRRMALDEGYRPGNLICGGGGRGDEEGA